jgi:hypothetical protein
MRVTYELPVSRRSSARFRRSATVIASFEKHRAAFSSALGIDPTSEDREAASSEDTARRRSRYEDGEKPTEARDHEDPREPTNR